MTGILNDLNYVLQQITNLALKSLTLFKTMWQNDFFKLIILILLGTTFLSILGGALNNDN